MTRNDDRHPRSAAPEEIEDHDRGLSHDLPRILDRSGLGRRRILRLLGGTGVVAATGFSLAACGSDDAGTGTTASSPSSAGTPPEGAPPGGAPPEGAPPEGAPPGDGAGGAESDVEVAEGEIPEETAGPYPGDGSNGANVLTESGVVRSDLTSSFGDAAGVAEGIPATVKLRVYDLEGEEVSALSGAAVYLWHCDRNGEYSLYSESIKDENYLRGVQETDKAGRVEFTTIFPACYDGRWPHMHFEIYQSLDDATSYQNKMRTSQLALPEEVCDAVYATEGYESSAENLAAVSLDSDMVFSDGHTLQMAKVSGSVEDGYTITLNVPV